MNSPDDSIPHSMAARLNLITQTGYLSSTKYGLGFHGWLRNKTPSVIVKERKENFMVEAYAGTISLYRCYLLSLWSTWWCSLIVVRETLSSQSHETFIRMQFSNLQSMECAFNSWIKNQHQRLFRLWKLNLRQEQWTEMFSVNEKHKNKLKNILKCF